MVRRAHSPLFRTALPGRSLTVDLSGFPLAPTQSSNMQGRNQAEPRHDWTRAESRRYLIYPFRS